MSRFQIKDKFYLDGEPFKIISGSFHYFRTVPEYWRDRLLKLKAMGGNTVETYIPWNMHEPKRGEFNFEGMLDLESFIKLTDEVGLKLILRPSPYICAEWEFGGLPAWLLKEDGMRLRVNYEPFMKEVEAYYDVLMPIITKYQIDNGGNVILMQIENEYGYYANDKSYMQRMMDIMKKHGVTVPLITSDGPFPENLNGGSIEGAHPTGNFGSRTEERFKVLENYTNGGPLMCAEFWVGWFDHWGNGGHMTGNLEESVRDLDKMLELGNVNIYMFEGGTNFGFMNGSNYYDELTPDVTSYDYDGILTEDGQITEKYRRYKEVISKYTEIPEVPELSESVIKRGAYGELKCEEKVSLFSVLDDISKKTSSVYPVSMEKLDQNYGYILYHSTLETEDAIAKIRLWDTADRANILVDKKPLITLYDLELAKEAEILTDEEIAKAMALPLEEQMKLSQRGKDLDILVENMGRVNFGPRMEHQRKGIGQCVQINGHMHNNWDMYTLPLDNIDKVDFSKDYIEGTPAFYKFTFEADECTDTFLDFEGWGKGCAFLNGFNLGRYWEIGPQKRLYIPAPLIKKGKNEIIMFETEGKVKDIITLKDEPDIG
ncbi:glycoside hydrolase family 35 protein [Butyrivibrio sp. WCD3002]|uniref:glycoside hydrolase family 35 protein n=1 Tax=Butyrivibrio sp. WCD3002 TaxID=1280676 RepID=UPI000478FBE8|nr:beta-galactosidase family protein [Butyrivibrio sp. WCD3002]